MELFREITLAALLWDIDKLYKQSAAKLVRKYRILFSKYVEVEELIGILEKKEKQQEYYKLIEKARGLSLYESDVSLEKNTNNCLLTSVFSRLSVEEKNMPTRMYYTMQPMGIEAIFPQNSVIDVAYEKQLSDFERELAVVSANSPDNFNDFITIFDTLLKKYCWCIPATSAKGEDVSLYEHMKITAAITACLLKNETNNPHPFKLVVGNFSGIQSYIFQVARTGVKGVAKRLRARSFYVDATVTVLAHYIVDTFNIPMGNILMLTGGKFYILLPNSADSDNMLEGIQQQAERFFFETFKGEISVNLAGVNFGTEGLKKYSDTITMLSHKLSEQKNKPFSHTLLKNGVWDESKFIIYDDLTGKTVCTSCGKALIDNNREDLCETCERHTEIGGKLTKTDYIIYSRGYGEYRLFKDYYISLARRNEITQGGKVHNCYRIEQLNNWQLPPDLTSEPLAIRVMANNIPTDANSEILTFSDIAEKAMGSKKLGVLKADVDNLGYIFADGLRTKERHYGTISRINTLSRMLEMFFSGYVNDLIRQKYPDIYSVFSGGDDLFVIGPWDVLPEFIIELEKKFKEFAAQNNCVTLSAAIVISNPKNHIAALAEICEKKLKTVKNSSASILYPNKQGRNAIYFMEQIFSWEDLDHQLSNALALADVAVDLPRAILRRIGEYSKMYQSFLETKDVFRLMFEPLFHYDRKRNYDQIDEEKFKWFLDYTNHLPDNAANYKTLKKDLFFADMVVRFALNKTREERNSGI